MEPIISIAIAEDQEMMRKFIIEILEGFGCFRVAIEAEHGAELLQKLAAAETLPDIVITDISMPGHDAYDAVDAIRKQWKELKILVLTMHKHEFAVIKMFRSGANGYLLKNCNPKELKNALLSIQDTGYYFSEIASLNLFNRVKDSNIIPELTAKEIQLIKLCHTDLTYKQIAKKMGVSENTVAGYRVSAFRKFGITSRTALVVCGIQMGLIFVD